MLVLITYDVNTETSAGRRRLRKVAKKCVDHGQRVQNSVFECLLDAAQFAVLKSELTALIDPELDSLRFYQLGEPEVLIRSPAPSHPEKPAFLHKFPILKRFFARSSSHFVQLDLYFDQKRECFLRFCCRPPRGGRG